MGLRAAQGLDRDRAPGQGTDELALSGGLITPTMNQDWPRYRYRYRYR